jgi:hypothetical protein
MGLSFRAMMRRALAGLTLLLSCACSSQSAVDFDHGRSTTGGGQTYGTGVRLEYPSAPYGATIGATIENFHFLGWSNPVVAQQNVDRLENIQLAQFYNPTGAAGGTKLLVITSTAVWCSACKLEYQDMAVNVGTFREKGVEFFGALFEDNDSNPAKPSDLVLWAQGYDVDFHFVLDPALKFGNFFDREATPMEMIVDAKNMQVLYIATGWRASAYDQNGNVVYPEGSLWWELERLLGG